MVKKTIVKKTIAKETIAKEITKQDKPKVYEKDCPYCGKLFYSLSEKQLLFNYTSHIGSCKFKKDKKEANK